VLTSYQNAIFLLVADVWVAFSAKRYSRRSY